MKRGERLMSSGLPQLPDKDDIVAVAHGLARLIRDESMAERASEAAARIHALNEASTRRQPGVAKLACAKGCGYCCHTWVSASVPEVLLLARAVRREARRNPDLPRAIAERSKPLAGLAPAARYGAKLPCPLLEENACSFYRERPTVCRQATSLDLAGCIDEFEGRGYGGDIKVSAVYLAHARNSRIPLLAALALVGLDARTYELSAALSRVLGLEDAERKWLAGEDIMAGIAQAPVDAGARQAIDAIVKVLEEFARA